MTEIERHARVVAIGLAYEILSDVEDVRYRITDLAGDVLVGVTHEDMVKIIERAIEFFTEEISVSIN